MPLPVTICQHPLAGSGAALFHSNFLRAAKRIHAGSLRLFGGNVFTPFFPVKILNQKKKSAHRFAESLRDHMARKPYQNLTKDFDRSNETALPTEGETGRGG